MNKVSYVFVIIESGQKRKSPTVTMSHQLKLNCPICNYPRLANLSDQLTKVHDINGQDRKSLL